MTTPKHFLDTLRRIGYDKVDKVDANAIEWAFENAATQPFVHWFCNNISADNVVTDQQLQEFHQLEAQGCVLEGVQLKETLNSLPAQTQDVGDVEALRSEIEELRQSLQQAKERKKLLVNRNNSLSVHQMALKKKGEKLRKVEEHWLKVLRVSLEKCRTVNTKIDEGVTQLATSVTALVDLYGVAQKVSKESRHGDSLCDFLSQTELKAFHHAEERFSKELTAFTKKQFFTSMADVTGERDTTQFTLLDVSSSESMSQMEEQDSAFLEDCNEFTRLQDIFPQSECNRINALMNAKKALSAVNEARSILHLVKSDQFPLSAREIIQRQQQVEQSTEATQAEAYPLVSALPELIQELGALQGTKILTGDYNLKLRRQDYFSKNQDKVIDHLVSQRARNEFLSMLYELEVKWHKETHHLISAARQTLEGHLLTWQQRMMELDDPEFGSKKFDRTVVDTRDTSTPRLNEMLELGDEEEKPLYLQTQKVVARAEKLKSYEKSAENTCKMTCEKYLHTVEKLESSTSECEAVLFSGSSTSRGLPVLSTPQVQELIATSASLLNTIEKKVQEVVNNINTKKTALKNNMFLGKERELFTLFHNDSSKLQHVVNSVMERIKAQQIQDS